MIRPECDQILALAGDYNIIPVCKEIYADMMTPISMLTKVSAISQRYYLLESVEGGEKWGRYSFLGYEPKMRVSCKDGIVTIETDGRSQVIETKKPLEVIRNILEKYKAPSLPDMPPFTGGFVGHFSYGMIGYAEPTLKLKSGEFEDYDLMLFDKIIAYDHLKQKICLIVHMKTDKAMENYGEAMAQLQKMSDLVRSVGQLPTYESDKNVDFVCNQTKEEYCDMVEKTKQYIYDGDTFQTVVSRRFESPYRGSLMNAYRVLRTTNPSPYMVYMKFDDKEIMSTSPETLVRLENGRLITFPVAGSRPRGKNPEEDKKLEAELLADEKERAEHNMLVDLGRNDLGRICKFGTVEVSDYMTIHKYSKIMHICSQVEGDIREDCDSLDAIESVLPAGTLSGAPKIRACEIIEELEGVPRGIYGGALGYLDFTGNMDTCIAIRMAVKKDDRVYVQAGAGIVADSVPETEYEETSNKAMAVIRAIQEAGEVND
ncbi:MAG: anthranilate synthase component I [Clostridia bacterium]|nr:anthranilate synthase component I [Lachnospiraceae bacterium]NCB99753.1 anthranilate synthase component I [Clostridia bacterium]NCD03880.1 anthranilate synthase component I [Clostridia bacterium]